MTIGKQHSRYKYYMEWSSMIIVSAKIEASELNNKTSIKLWTIIITKQNKWTRIYTCTVTISSQCSCIYTLLLLFLHNAHSFASLHVGYKVL